MDEQNELNGRFPLESIRDDEHLSQALAIADDLLKRKLDEGGENYLDALSDHIIDYEKKRFPEFDDPIAE